MENDTTAAAPGKPQEHGRVGKKRGPKPRSASARTASPREEPERRAPAHLAAQQGVKPTDQGEEVEQGEAAEMARDEDPHEITRKSRSQRNLNFFEVPQKWKKTGWDYQYVVEKVMGQPVESTEETYEAGWRPVYWKDIPKPWPPHAKSNEQVRRGGQALFTRPKRLTDQAVREEYDAAERQKMDRINSARGGHAGLSDVKGVRAVDLGTEIQGEVGVHRQRSQSD